MTRQELEELLAFLEETPDVVRRLAQDLSGDELRWKPSPEEFSFLENVCHLRDIECEGYSQRIPRLLGETDPFLPDVDGTKLAAERDYQAQDLGEGVGEFTRLRLNNVGLLRNASASDLERSGTFEGTGRVTLGRLAEMMREHDDAHRDELDALWARLLRRRAAAS